MQDDGESSEQKEYQSISKIDIMTEERKARLEKMEQEQLNWKKQELDFKLNNKQLPKS